MLFQCELGQFPLDLKDICGSIIQELICKWLESRNYKFTTKQNTQEFPDILLHGKNGIESLLEIKSFDLDRSPNFDVANFESYVAKVLQDVRIVFTDYLIFGYRLNKGILKIEKIWKKKVWEITGRSSRYPVKTQVKRNIIYNIRPVSFHSSKKVQFSCFQDKETFIQAIQDTLNQYPKTKSRFTTWQTTVLGMLETLKQQSESTEQMTLALQHLTI